MILIAHAMVDAADHGMRRWDFLRGEEPYKYAWGAIDEPRHGLRLNRES
jgi:CelD/BcsL family acetyltransferase involved in cellulose biosynthesis